MADVSINSKASQKIKIDGTTVLTPYGDGSYMADKLFFSAVKEEEWLCYMASKGYALKGRKFKGYIFDRDANASKYYYSVCLLPAQAETDYAKDYMENKSKHGTSPVCTFSNKAYYRTPVTEKSNGIVNDAVLKYKHLRRAFAFHFGFLLFWLGLLCYNISYWVRFDAAGVTVEKKAAIWKYTINMTKFFGNYPTTPYISLFICIVILCIPFTVYYLDQFMYSRFFLKRVQKIWRKR